MTAPVPPPDQPLRPPVCAACGSGDLKPHCPNPRCPWSRCQVLACKQITGFVLGRPNHIADLYPGQGQRSA